METKSMVPCARINGIANEDCFSGQLRTWLIKFLMAVVTPERFNASNDCDCQFWSPQPCSGSRQFSSAIPRVRAISEGFGWKKRPLLQPKRLLPSGCLPLPHMYFL